MYRFLRGLYYKLRFGYDWVDDFHEGYAVAKKHDRYFHIRPDGTRPYRQTYKSAGQFSTGLAAVEDDGNKWFHINSNGYPAYDHRFKWTSRFLETGYAHVELESGANEMINRKGVVMPPLH